METNEFFVIFIIPFGFVFATDPGGDVSTHEKRVKYPRNGNDRVFLVPPVGSMYVRTDLPEVYNCNLVLSVLRNNKNNTPEYKIFVVFLGFFVIWLISNVGVICNFAREKLPVLLAVTDIYTKQKI